MRAKDAWVMMGSQDSTLKSSKLRGLGRRRRYKMSRIGKT